MEVEVATSLGMCFGVRDAIQLALSHPRRHELTVLGELVHNRNVLAKLDAAGIRQAAGIDSPAETREVLITAHGASEQAVQTLQQRGHQVVDATCPLVRHAHRCLRRLIDQGYFPVVIGQRHHAEVRGLVEDLAEVAVVETVEDLQRIPRRPRLGVVSQTTQPLALVRSLVDQLRAERPEAEVRFVDTICQPTKERQEAARRLARTCTVVVVVGGANSNNTRQLTETCRAEGARVHQVTGEHELRGEWFVRVRKVGLTAGTSTPDEVVEAVRQAILRLGREESLRRSLARTPSGNGLIQGCAGGAVHP